MSDLYYDDNQPSYNSTLSSKLPYIHLAAKIATFASLLVSLIILKVNTGSYDNGFVLTYDNYFLSYKYMFYVSAIGIAYSFCQIPLAVYYVKTGKRIIQSPSFVLLEFYGDKVLSFLLGTGVGAAFGATRDLKKYTNDDDSDVLQFFDMDYIAATFLFIGCLASLVSSILSSLGLAKRD